MNSTFIGVVRNDKKCSVSSESYVKGYQIEEVSEEFIGDQECEATEEKVESKQSKKTHKIHSYTIKMD